MPLATIRLDYSDSSYEVHRYEFDTLKDAVIYSRLIRMRKQAVAQQKLNAKVKKNTKIYKQLVADGLVESGKTIYHKDVDELREKIVKETWNG